jgi:oligopeptide transport system permease protein
MCWKGLSLSLFLGLVESAIVVIVGTLVGLAWGYFRWLDRIMIEIYNLISNVPSLLLYMLLASIIKEAFPNMASEVKLIISLTITGWIGVALFIRNQTIIITNREYNVASITLGTPAKRIMTRNLLPYLLPVVIQSASMTIPGMISSEVSMSFFGVGLPTDTISVGILLDQGRAYFMQYPWQLLAPAGMLAIIILAFYLIGLALSDAMDPKNHR